MRSDYENNIAEIIDAHQNGRLALFIGAGISRCANNETTSFLNWQQLINEIKKFCGDIEGTDFLKIAQLLYLDSPKEYNNRVKSLFPEAKTSSVVHHKIMELHPRIIITTNWDNLLSLAAEECYCFYDNISSDEELIKSSIPNKIIKMHGDFSHKNFVFKEDDYINYQNNFPLIENFVKSIMSTHTLLFLGYSYNDINLKQIVNWIQLHSKERPAMFIVADKHNPAQEKYLDNYGLKTLVISKTSKTSEALTDEKSKKIYHLLSLLTSNLEDNYIEDGYNSIDFVLKRLLPLDELDGLLLSQIQKTLSNCGFVYDSSDLSPILQFYFATASYDSNKQLRNIYADFIKQLNKKSSSESLNMIFSILAKAGIKGIITKGELPQEKKEYIRFDDVTKIDSSNTIGNYIDFNYAQANNVLDKVALCQYERAHELTKKSIQSNFHRKSYFKYLVSIFNHNITLYFLKYYPSEETEDYKNNQDIDIEEKYDG